MLVQDGSWVGVVLIRLDNAVCPFGIELTLLMSSSYIIDWRKLVGDLEDAQADQDSLQEKDQSLSEELIEANQEISDLNQILTVTRQRDAALVEVDSLRIQLNEQLSENQALKKLTESHAEIETRYEDAMNEVDQLRKLVGRMDLQARQPPRTPTESIPAVPPFRPKTALPSEVEPAFQATADTCKQGDAQPKAELCVKGQPQAEPNAEGEHLKKTPFQDHTPASQTSVKPKGKDPEARPIKPKSPELTPDTVQKPPAVEQAYMEDLPFRSAGPPNSSTYATAAQTKPMDIFSFYDDICKEQAMDPPSMDFLSKLPPSAIRVLPKPNTTAVKSQQPSPNTPVSSPARSELGQPIHPAATTAQYKPVRSKAPAAASGSTQSGPTHAKPTTASPALSKSTQPKGSAGQFGSTQPGATRAKTSAAPEVQPKPRKFNPSTTPTGQAGSSQTQGSGMPSCEDWLNHRSSLEPRQRSPWHRPTGLNVVEPGTRRIERQTISNTYSGGVITGLELSSSNSGSQTAGAQQGGKAPNCHQQTCPDSAAAAPIKLGSHPTPPGFEQTHPIKALAMKDDESKGKKRLIMESDTSDTDTPPSKKSRPNIRPPTPPRN
ncbi:MAG: hypothetical protein Q9210_001043 [Variospora velana]